MADSYMMKQLTDHENLYDQYQSLNIHLHGSEGMNSDEFLRTNAIISSKTLMKVHKFDTGS